MTEEMDNQIQLSGTIRQLVFQNEENGYTVVKLETTDGETVTVVGCLPYACPGEQIIATGRFVTDAKFGVQFKAELAERILPREANAIYEFLSSRAIRGVGPATATLIVSAFGPRSLDVIENDPEQLAAVRGITRKKALEISEAYKKQAELRKLLACLANYGGRPAIALRLYRAYGSDALGLLEENPYAITGEAVGASFAEADALAMEMGFEEDSPERVAAAATYELRYNAFNGHSFIPADKLVAAVGEAKRVLIVDECRITGSQSEALMALFTERTPEKKLARIAAEDSFIPLGPAATVTLTSVAAICERAEALIAKPISNATEGQTL